MATRPLPEQDKRDWLRLIRSTHLGPITFHHILRYYGSAAEAIARLPEIAARGGGKRKIELAAEKTVAAELKALKACNARLLAWGEPGYPTGLMQLEDAPPLLAAKGDVASVSALPGIAMVGARNASAIGQRFTRDIAAALTQHGFAVLSGLARGIDKAAHEGALGAKGKTAAFIGTGIDVAFPPENARLQDEIAERGAVLAEMPAGTPPLAQNFPRRNRLISGASMGVLVVEAALKSGSLITARMAAEQGREVMAVPGSPLDPRCRGSNGLIRDGAALIETVDDILAILAPQQAQRRAETPTPKPTPIADDDLSRAHAEIERLLSPSPVLVDDLVRLSGMASSLVQMVLTEQELAGRVLRHPGGKVSAA
ncbi:DNA-processing protein DprA [Ferrovibrio sp.]|uniref:DNA-processing protein DprA n=1 Tax=Ferrovibrio sp. TaxID=1917215 RepID=UPI0025C5894D|nr:DNA-processing protein DprA [Ferrovibrio sp.]